MSVCVCVRVYASLHTDRQTDIHTYMCMYIYIYIYIRIWSLCVYVFDEHRAGFRAAPDAKAASGGFLTAWVMPQPFGVLPTFSTRKA